ncbi:proline-rich receptor-like protein kinase PERK4 [Solanum tuberosum]|uniref:non-specific serine/threonine protein kinase n=2 Tax=Solanum TaxID=4107 RepID=M1C9I0_SOLTU|nr:PREDICTED: proline-rich receptor-like protein kinase PERK4 [Solanum tuberosum]
MLVFLISCCKRKRRRPRDQMGYYRDNSHGGNSTDYYNSGPYGNWHNNNNIQSTDHMVKMPNPQAPSTNVSSELSWPIAPPPPPPMMSSSELSSAAFSGPQQPPLPPPHPSMALGFNQSSFTYDDLSTATGGFVKSNLLGQGGFGFVHKGVLPNGKDIAVKSLKANSGQGEREFQAEVEIISRVHHRHLVSLVGYCIAGSQRLLVYEFVPNGTLEYHLHGTGRPVMDFPTRLKIALGSAKGFAYLHEDCHPRIIHRDIKAANILLDHNCEAKVADFGLAKLSNDTNTHVSTRIMGTFGYLAPEYASSGKLTEKSDVYSYGVMLLELITGRRPIDISSDDDTLVEWARPILIRATEGGNYDELIDPRLEGNFDAQEMLCMVACAAASIRHSARRRPKMSQIVRALEGDVSLDDLNEGMKKSPSTAMFGSSESSEYDGGSYDLKKFKKSGMSSQEFTSSEHGTGEFVHSGGESQEHGQKRHTP